MRDLMRLVQQLDGMNRYRFRDNLEKLGAWESARNAAWRKEPQPAAAPVPAPTAAPTPTTAAREPVAKDELAA
jgi:hypothetical protein